MKTVPGAQLERIAYTLQEAAAVTGLSRATLYRNIALKKLEVRKVGRRTIVTPQALRAMIESEAA